MTSPDPSPEKKPGDSPAQPEPAAEQIAARYIDEQLEKARTTLRRSRVIGIVVVLLVLAYFGFLTIKLRSDYLRPKEAAEMANAFAANLVQENGPVLAEKLKQEIPAIIQKLPDTLIEQLPKFREDLEDKIEQHFTLYCSSTAEELAGHLDTFLEENKESINDFMEAAQEPEGAEALGEALEDELRLYLEEPGDDGESIQDKLQASLQMLQHIQLRLDHLLKTEDLSPRDQNLRRAIAVIMKTTESEVSPIVK